MTGRGTRAKAEENPARRAGRWFGLGVFLLALLVRGGYLADSRDNPTFQTPIVDSQTYDGLARSLAAGGPVMREFFWQPIFYPLFLSLVYRLSHSPILWAKILQCLLGALTALLTYHLGRRLFGRAAGVAAGVVAAIYMPLVFYETELLASGWAAFWMVALALLLLMAKQKPKPLLCFVLGLAGALSIITRPEFLPLFAASCVWLLAAWWRERRSAAGLLSRGLVTAAGFLLVTVPLGIATHRVLGRATILPTSGGINLYIGNNPDYAKTITVRPGLGWRELTALPTRQGIVDDWGMQRYFLNKTREYILGQPWSFIKGLVHKTAQFFSSREIPRNTDIYLFRKWSWSLRWLVWKLGRFGFPFGMLLPLALGGLILRRRELPGPLLLSLLLYPAFMILVFVTSRYRVPVVPLLSVLAAAGMVAAWRMAQELRWKILAVSGAAVLAAAIAAGSTRLFPEERLDYEAELHYGLGSTYDAWGEPEEAKSAYERALEIRADYAEAHYNLANILKAQGRLEEAIKHYARAAQAEPDSVEIRNNFGTALKAEGRINQAVEQWEKALELAPADPFARYNLALAMAELGKDDLSLEHAREALRQRPDWAEIHVDLGMVLLQRGEAEAALVRFEEALRIRPADADAHSGLGIALASRGELDRAIEHFRRAVQIEPRHVEARYNLGHALELQGKWAEAAAEFRRLLEIDPGHAQARAELEKALARQRQER